MKRVILWLLFLYSAQVKVHTKARVQDTQPRWLHTPQHGVAHHVLFFINSERRMWRCLCRKKIIKTILVLDLIILKLSLTDRLNALHFRFWWSYYFSHCNVTIVINKLNGIRSSLFDFLWLAPPLAITPPLPEVGWWQAPLCAWHCVLIDGSHMCLWHMRTERYPVQTFLLCRIMPCCTWTVGRAGLARAAPMHPPPLPFVSHFQWCLTVAKIC